ncbi:MAG: GspE/PulE family protein [Patescibacteria group bacterium]
MPNFNGFEKIKQELAAAGVWTTAIDAAAKAVSFESSGQLFGWLIDHGGQEETALYGVLEKALQFPYADLRGKTISDAVLHLIPLATAQTYQGIAFGLAGKTLSIGLVDPYNFRAIEAIEFLVKQQKLGVRYWLISPRGYADALRQYSHFTTEVKDALAVVEQDRHVASDEPATSLTEIISQAPVAKIVSEIIKQAINQRASDIHIEAIAGGSRVRFRIDGIMRTALDLPTHVHASVISRIKVLADLKLDETRIPQDGRISLVVEGRPIDFRVSTMPLLDTEKVVLRILPGSDQVPTLTDLGFHDFQIKIMTDSIHRPHGLFLISGPTGSGKSTTLYSLLAMLNSQEQNITTLEDPIEFHLNGINQSQIRPEVDFTFASGLRALLRQDPDIIMVGEIRDAQTAEMSIHAGLTGHLIFSTIHTNDAIGVGPRLIDMGVEPFLLASTLNVVVAQRLVRRICSQCLGPAAVPAYLLEKITKELGAIEPKFLPPGVNLNNLKFMQGKGCAVCSQTGYQGRLAIAEIILATEEFRRLIVSHYDAAAVKQELQRQHMVTLMQDGLIRAVEGLTTIDEVLRVTQL